MVLFYSVFLRVQKTKTMLKVNTYYEGRVKSISFQCEEGPATMGVVTPGEYEFQTTSTEYLTVTSGLLYIMLPSQSAWKAFKPYETLIIPPNIRFRIMAKHDASYKCVYKQ
jgi:hypothetical protein